MSRKGRNTSRVAGLIGLLAILVFVAFFMDMLTAREVFDGLGALGVFGAVLVGLLSKDQNAKDSIE